jgi:hypothetical protein
LDITHSNGHQVHIPVEKIKSHFIKSARDNIAEQYDLDRIKSAVERLEFIDSPMADNKNRFPIAERVEGGGRCPNPMQSELKAANDWPVSTLLPVRNNPAVSLLIILS